MFLRFAWNFLFSACASAGIISGGLLLAITAGVRDVGPAGWVVFWIVLVQWGFIGGLALTLAGRKH